MVYEDYKADQSYQPLLDLVNQKGNQRIDIKYSEDFDTSEKKAIEDNSYYDTDFRGFEVKEPSEVCIDQTKIIH